ncbi:hypothetical protein FE257_003565 [Aspergillus nanangensis]|uniref:Zn(2)-C6 fungal-type domain-containing protein n=1 Tax=Aspergillus nanangensis TaxID=2582783 RepID=A0AAD4GMR0_ASPNN|nr:hypothetical protein FE257_003565 [Aspergillus nanangensis]
MRKIHRKSLSCTECTRRKLRCSKTIPCSACVDRNISHRCKRRQDPSSTSQPIPNNLSENASIFVPPAPLSSGQNTRPRPFDDSLSTPTGAPSASHTPTHRMIDSVATDAAVTLEFLALGRQRIVHSNRKDRDNAPYSTLAAAEDTILSGPQVKAAMQYHHEHLTWMHNVVHLPTFIDQCDVYFLAPGSQEGSWMALYYAMLAFTLYHVHPDVLGSMGIDASDHLAETCYNKSIRSLHDADFMTVHSISSVQCICLLIYVGYNLGQSDKISVLLACGVRIAQSLCMHRLGPDRPNPTAKTQLLVDREVQKRTWWFLVRQDWLQIPFINTYTIHPSQFNTPMPSNCFDDVDRMVHHGSIAEQSKNIYTHNSYTSVLNDVSVLIWKTQDKMCSLGPPHQADDGLKKLYGEVINADEKLRFIMKNMPSFFQKDSTIDHYFPESIQQQRDTLYLGLAHKFYSIHRHFQVPSYKDPWFAYSKVSCLPIMRHSLRAVLSLPNDDFTWAARNLWTVSAHVVTSAVWLIFDLILSREDRSSLFDDTEIHESDGSQRFNLEEIISRVEENEEEFQSIGAISVFDWLSRGPNNFGDMMQFLDNEVSLRDINEY